MATTGAIGLSYYPYIAIGTNEQEKALDLAHIRNNQRRSRARRREYVTKLEGKIQELQSLESDSSLLQQLESTRMKY